jgi:squalene cyclase
VDNDKYWASLWGVVTICATLLTMVGIEACKETNIAAISKGLCQQQNVGSSGNHWEKCR